VPTVTVAIDQGFTKSAKAIGKQAGVDLHVATYPGVIATHDRTTIAKNIEDVLVQQIVQQLTSDEPTGETMAHVAEPQDRDVVFRGTFEEVNDFFLRSEWSDGLPIVPPTIEKVEAFLRFTDRRLDDVLGTLHPSRTQATVWNVAVNGVMAGCRPEYMPVLVAIVEVMCNPQYGMEHGGSTPGWEAMIILNGPIRGALGFDDKQGAQRPGNQANTSVGRFYRLFARNVPRFLPGTTDMATFGQMFRAVIAENEQACADMGWDPLHVTRGFQRDENVVTITSVRTGSDPFSSAGESAEPHLELIVDWVKRMIEPYQSSRGYVESHVLILTPVIASLLAKAGYSKRDAVDHLKKNATVLARYYERHMMLGDHHTPGTTIAGLVEQGALPREWHLSDDPDRLVPLLLPQSDILIVVAGDPLRNRSCLYRQNFKQGYATSAKIELPKRWDVLMQSKSLGAGSSPG
jgi:hypothetical protein